MSEEEKEEWAFGMWACIAVVALFFVMVYFEPVSWTIHP